MCAHIYIINLECIGGKRRSSRRALLARILKSCALDFVAESSLLHARCVCNSHCMCVCVKDREKEWQREKEKTGFLRASCAFVWACVRVKQSVCLCMYVCVREWEKERRYMVLDVCNSYTCILTEKHTHATLEIEYQRLSITTRKLTWTNLSILTHTQMHVSVSRVCVCAFFLALSLQLYFFLELSLSFSLSLSLTLSLWRARMCAASHAFSLCLSLSCSCSCSCSFPSLALSHVWAHAL